MYAPVPCNTRIDFGFFGQGIAMCLAPYVSYGSRVPFLGWDTQLYATSAAHVVPSIRVFGWGYYYVYRAICVVWLPRLIRGVGYGAVCNYRFTVSYSITYGWVFQ